MEAGVDSLGAVELRNQLQAAIGLQVALPTTLIFDHTTARLLMECAGADRSCSTSRSSIASLRVPMFTSSFCIVCISGVTALLAGGVTNPSEHRLMFATGHDVATEVPPARWNVVALDQEAGALGLDKIVRQRMRYGAFVKDAQLFSSSTFGISTAEASAMDPQQRLLLEQGYISLQQSQMFRADVLQSNTGVYLGYSSSDFAHVLATNKLGESVYSATGSAGSIAAGRLSYALGLHGPCAMIDTACSAGLVAASFAHSALVLHGCDGANVMAVNLILSADGMHTPFAIAGMTSATGKCHSFDRHTDGYVRSEMCGAATLRVDKAASLGVDGCAVRCDGKSASLTAPNGQAQRLVIQSAHSMSQSGRGSVILVEAHGTGTALGDPI